MEAALSGLYIAGLLALAGVLTVIGKRAGSYIERWFDQKEKELLRQTGADAAIVAEVEGQKTGAKGPEKLELARQHVASILPGATPQAVDTAISVGVAKLKASVPSADLLHPIPVTVVGSSIPPPPKVPGGMP